LRVFLGSSGAFRTANTSTSDFSEAGLASPGFRGHRSGSRHLAGSLRRLARTERYGPLTGELGLYYDDVYSLPTAERIEYARRAEAAALSADPRLTKSDGGSFDAATTQVMANSRGFAGEYRRFLLPPFRHADRTDRKRGHAARLLVFERPHTGQLDSPESIGAGGRRTLRRLNGRRVSTQQVPIVFAPEIARSLIGNIFEAANGDSIYRGASFWNNQLGQKVASDNVTVIDDGTLPGLFGTSPFDGEGLPTRRTVIVENGVPEELPAEYLYRAQTQHASTEMLPAFGGNPGIGGGNLSRERFCLPAEAACRRKGRLLCHRADGFGVNMVPATTLAARRVCGLRMEKLTSRSRRSPLPAI